ncbi:MAG: PIG-L family deacetylase [Clostridia bacterium]|nr:PIG-L family deacetylase [Clostridia bacterium]
MRITQDKVFKTISLLFLLCILIAAAVCCTVGSRESERYKALLESSDYSTVLYFSAHQDDETLEDFGGILQDLRTGKEVHVVLCSDGSASGIYKLLLEEGHDLTMDEFTALRDIEFTNALVSLGVPAKNVHIPDDRLQDGTFADEKDRLKAFVRYWVDQYPNAAVRTHSPKLGDVENHTDHTTLGDVCCELQDEGVIKRLRLFVDKWHIEEYRAIKGLTLYKLPAYGKLIRDEADRLDGAKHAYSDIDIKEGRYGIGGRSVAGYWENLEQNPVSYFYDREAQ